MQFLDFCLLLTAVTVNNGNVHAFFQGSTMHTSYGYTTRIVAVVQTGNKHLGRSLQYFGSRDVLQNAIQQIGNVICRVAPVFAHPALLGRTIDNGEVQLVLCGIQIAHQVKHHFIHLLGSAVRLIHLVDDHYGLQTNLQCLLKYKARLRHRALKGIYQQEASVGHIQHTLHLAAKVAMARRVNDVYLSVLVVNTNVLREDGDSALTLQLVVIQHQFTCLLVLAEKVTSQQHLVYQRSLTMVYVGNDCYVSNTLHICLLFYLIAGNFGHTRSYLYIVDTSLENLCAGTDSIDGYIAV